MRQNRRMQPDPDALEVLMTLRRAGYEAYFVGGCIRDHLMGRPPKDWDIATSARPEQVEALFAKTVAVGKTFGVILVVGKTRCFEVATFRGDGYYSDGRRPDTVTFTSAREDAKRRDFTINALMYDPASDTILDFVGGRADIEARTLRAVGDAHQRFREDHLRLLRAVRFAARTGFRLAPETLTAIRDLASLVNTVSGERSGDELTRMLTEGYARSAFALLDRTTLLDTVLPEVTAMKAVPQPPQFHPEGDVYAHTMLMLEMLDDAMQLAATPDPGRTDGSGESTLPRLVEREGEKRFFFPAPQDRVILGWAVLLHDVGKPDTLTHTDRIRFNCHDEKGVEIAARMLRRFRRSGKTAEAVLELIGRHMRFSHLAKMREAKRRRFLRDPLFPLHLELHRLDCVASHGKLDCYRFAGSAWQQEQARTPEREPLLKGTDLIAMGFAPGPRMGRILAAVEDARLEDKIATPGDARTWVREHFPRT